MEDMIVVEALDKDGGLIETIQMDSNEYYDGETYDAIVSAENLNSKNIASIKLTQFGSQGKPYQILMLSFDDKGYPTKEEHILDEDYS